MQVRKQKLELDQQTGSKEEKEEVKAVYCHPAYLTAEYIMRNSGLEEAQAGIKITGRNISNLTYADDTTLMAESEEELKSLLMKVKEESEKVDLMGGRREEGSGWGTCVYLWQMHVDIWQNQYNIVKLKNKLN